MMQSTVLEFPEVEVKEKFFGERSTFLSAMRNYESDSLDAVAEDATVSEAGTSMAATLFGARGRSGRIQRSEARANLNAPLWVTSLCKPGIFEVVPTANVSRMGIRLVTQIPWEPDETVLVSSPPELCREGSVVYCRKLPSDDYALGIRLDAPVEHWTETLAHGNQ
jgi:hypothetical protein